jgi:hypothetical protein
VFCTALATSGKKAWSWAWQLYQKSSDRPSVREDLLNTLGCTKEVATLEVTKSTKRWEIRGR